MRIPIFNDDELEFGGSARGIVSFFSLLAPIFIGVRLIIALANALSIYLDNWALHFTVFQMPGKIAQELTDYD